MAEHLNTDAMAVLAVIRNEAETTGRCTLPVARIAERANVGRAKTRAAIRLAIHRAIQYVGRIASGPVLGGLHHHYCKPGAAPSEGVALA